MPIQPLPDNADLDRFKSVAKLLRGLVRAGDESAIGLVAEHHPRLGDLTLGDPRAADFPLSGAQLTLARQHGFASWPRLKRHIELRKSLSRSPHRQASLGVASSREATKGGQPGDQEGIAGQEESVEQAEHADALLRLAGLDYGTDDRTRARPTRARQLLDQQPALATVSIHTMAATGASDAAAAVLAADPAAASTMGGPYEWPPLLYACYSRLPRADTLPVARLLLEAGADPNAGFLWDGLVPPFTALTGALGGGERGEPPHPRSLELVALLLDAGADPNDGQAIYNRGLGDVARDDTDWLELLLVAGFGRGEGGPWYRLLAPAAQTPQQLMGEALQHAAEAGLAERTRLLLRYGADPNGRGTHPIFSGRTAYQGAVLGGSPTVVELLEAAGADRSTVDPASRLVGACLAADAAAVERITAGAPQLVAALRHGHPNLVRRAAELGRPAAVRLLVSLGFDVNGAERRTPLHEAAFRGHDDVIRTLLALGADPTITDPTHQATPEGWASYAGYGATARLLAGAASQRSDGG